MKISEDEAKDLASRMIDEGGFTFPRPPAKGYMVGGCGVVLVIPAADLSKESQSAEYILANHIIAIGLQVSRDNYLGGWADRADMAFHIEESHHYITRDAALLFARKWKQKAVFNLTTKTSENLSD